MFVVSRGLTAAGMSTYAVIHLFQMASPPEGSPTWLRFAYGLTALVALVISVAALFDERHHFWSAAGALLAAGSGVALVMSVTVGFLGVESSDLQPAALIAVVAELMTVAAYGALVAARAAGPEAAAETDDAERGDYRRAEFPST